MNNYDVIVVGAGISGMSFAHYAAKAGKEVLVLEKSDSPGGSLCTAQNAFAVDSNAPSQNPFWIELGAHTCYNSYQNLIDIIEDCGIANQITARAKVPFRLWKNDKVKSFTSQINFLEMLISVPRIFTSKKDGRTVAEYYGSIVGRRNFKKVFSALFSAVPSQNADDFPADALFKKRARRKDILKHYTLKNGLGSIAEAIAAHHNFEITYGTNINGLEAVDAGYRVRTNHGAFECANLAICTPVGIAASLTTTLHPALSSLLNKIRYQQIESFGVVVPAESTPLKPFAGLVPVDDVFFSAVSRDTVPDSKYRGFTFHFKPGACTAEEKTEKVCHVLGVDQSQILDSYHKINIVPSLRLGHYDLVKQIEQQLGGSDLYLGGNYFAGLSIEDCVSRSKEEVRRMLKRRTS